MVQRQNQYNLSVERIPDDGLPDAENIMPRSVIHANGFPKLASPPQSMDIERNDKFTGFNNPTLERYLPLSASTIEIGDQSFDFDKSQLATGPFNIAGVAAEESDYLMTLYWDQHAPTLPIVDKTLYLESKRQHSTDYYSLFLELCMLALGLKLADPKEAVLRHCRRQRKENLLYEQARKVYEETVGHCPDIPALQAMLLLEDLESRMGNIELARAISGMYCATMLYGLFFLASRYEANPNRCGSKVFFYSHASRSDELALALRRTLTNLSKDQGRGFGL